MYRTNDMPKEHKVLNGKARREIHRYEQWLHERSPDPRDFMLFVRGVGTFQFATFEAAQINQIRWRNAGYHTELGR